MKFAVSVYDCGMSVNEGTQTALEQLKEAEFVVEHQEGSNRARRLSPADLLQLRDLENKLASDDARSSNGIYRILD